MTILVSVIIPVYNDSRLLSTLDTLKKQSYFNCQIIVVDDCSDKVNIKNICDNFFGVKYIKSNVNVGSYACRNIGTKAALGDILAFTDSDCILDKDWIKLGVDFIKKNNLSIVGGKIQMIGFEFKIDEYLDSCLHLRQDIWVSKRNFAATGNAFIKKEVFEEVGLFDEKLRSMGDFEFGNRAFIKGYKIGYAEDAIAYHPARSWDDLIEKVRRCNLGLLQISKPSLKYYAEIIINIIESTSLILKDKSVPNQLSRVKLLKMFLYLQLLKIQQALNFSIFNAEN
ncbi:glycosyltransferase family 2 protein [Anabaena cylindrica UHCC 0172]|uniref:glycosyltransferase family 2 protein n=1 Tax=Anabaena cylindrica TaxID=1165 RepID=UPI002B213CCF|nr:glycosyltransferase family 2 protein [Anabaena cylindrica]MEA5553325.1 glycosyltransferase family 2 protein [Anabaena cylindrica UHCC 0172]